MKLISDTLGVSRSHLRQSFCKTVGEPRKPRGKAPAVPDAGVLQLLHELVEARPSYGYRRACAVVNRKLSVQGKPRVNHKRIYRLMSWSNPRKLDHDLSQIKIMTRGSIWGIFRHEKESIHS